MMLSFKWFTFVILFLLALILFGIFYPNIRPQTYDIKLFSVANNTIRSPKTVIDEEKTKEEKQLAAASVAKVYTFDSGLAQNRLVMAGLILVIALALMKMAGILTHLEIPGIEYAYPAAMAPLLARILLRDRSAFLLSALLAACASIEFHGDIADTFNAEMVVYALITGTGGILLLPKRPERAFV